MSVDNDKDKYEEYDKKCNKCTKAVLSSCCAKKIIVAGPGTGKSFLFQLICKDMQKNGKGRILALSFINELVDNLAKDLYKMAEVKTLHSFALRVNGASRHFYDMPRITKTDVGGEVYHILTL